MTITTTTPPPNTAGHSTIARVEASFPRLRRLTLVGDLAIVISVVLLTAALVVGALVIRDLWPPDPSALHGAATGVSP